MKKIFFFVIPVVLLSAACTKDISRFNIPTKQPAVVPPGPIFTYATKQLTDIMADCGGNNTFRHIVEHWSQTIIEDAAQYNFNVTGNSDAWWNRMYLVLNNLKACDSVLQMQTTTAAPVLANERTIVDIMSVYTWNVLVNTYGNIPYSQALNWRMLNPKYDDAKTIQQDLETRLAADIAKLDPTNASFASTEDLYYGGKVSSWVAFGNSLMMKIAMTLADVDATHSQSLVEAASPKAFQSQTTDAIWHYLAVPNNNPTYQAIVLSGRQDFIACSTLIDTLKAYNDPRLPGFFSTNNNGAYAGAPLGAQVVFALMSKPSARLSKDTTSYIFMDYIDMEFYRAEAIERGFNVGGTAEQHYNTAITLSIEYWGGSATDAQNYLALPNVAYTTAAGTWRQKIGLQKWIAMYCRGFDGWTDLRRFDYPIMIPPIGAVSGFPNRLTYPAVTYTEQALNGANYTQAAAAIGGDKAETKLYWDIY
jgi:hypothetical protein